MNNTSMALYFNEDKYKIYKNRVIVCCVFLVLFLLFSIYLSFTVIKKIEITPIGYTDTGTVDYRVYLKENEFYTEQFLPKGKAYVTSLIDYIDINYNYIFNIDALSNIKFNYKIIGDLVIEDGNKKELLTKSYEVLPEQKKEMRGTNELVINEKFQIDYGYYNQLANKFRSSYGLDSSSYLKIYLDMKKNTTDEESYTIDEETRINELIIPLSERTIEINIDSRNNKTNNQVVFDKTTTVNYTNVVILIIVVILLINILRILTVSYKKMNRRRSLYDKYVNRLLKEYDRLIVETGTLIDFRKYNVIRVFEFNELLDVRDNLKTPINYYCLSKHVNGLFYIKAEDDIYVLYISSELLEKEK